MSSSSSSSGIPRTRPPMGVTQTFVGVLGQSAAPKHGYKTIYDDRDILAVHKLTDPVVQGGLTVRFNPRWQAVIRQGAENAGAATASRAMLMIDSKSTKKVDPDSLFEKEETCAEELGETLTEKFTAAGLIPTVTVLPAMNKLSALHDLIKTHGSAIVSIKVGGFRHNVIVDSVTTGAQPQVALRDPYHGWSIAVKAPAFLATLVGTHVVQAKASGA